MRLTNQETAGGLSELWPPQPGGGSPSGKASSPGYREIRLKSQEIAAGLCELLVAQLGGGAPSRV